LFLFVFFTKSDTLSILARFLLFPHTDLKRSVSELTDKADYILDVRGAISPFSLLKVSLVFQQMKPEQVVEILGCDSEMQRDLLRVLPEGSCEVVFSDSAGREVEVSRVRLKKRAQATAT
jgi:TusA-related sulfurtransferase